MAGLYSRRYTYLHLAAGMCTLVKRRLGDSFSGLDRFLDAPVLTVLAIVQPVGKDVTGCKVCWRTGTKGWKW